MMSANFAGAPAATSDHRNVIAIDDKAAEQARERVVGA